MPSSRGCQFSQDRTFETLQALAASPGKFVSGASLSARLGVSRTAVWKHMQTLRKQGAEIESVTNRGYRLVEPVNVLLPAIVAQGLETERFGKNLRHFATTISTQAAARDLATAGAPDGTVVLAEAQSGGRGRMGRAYFCPRGGLWFTILLRPPLLPTQASLLSLGAGVAVAEAIEDETRLRPVLKWPNDLLLDGRKVTGVLTEMDAEEGLIHSVLVGIGVNVNIGWEFFPADLRPTATSLQAALGRSIDRAALLRRILARYEPIVDGLVASGPGTILERWRAWPNILGQRVRVSRLDRSIEGLAVDLDESGALLLRLSDGREERVLAGDVSPVPAHRH